VYPDAPVDEDDIVEAFRNGTLTWSVLNEKKSAFERNYTSNEDYLRKTALDNNRSPDGYYNDTTKYDGTDKYNDGSNYNYNEFDNYDSIDTSSYYNGSTTTSTNYDKSDF
jgi:hypothetical protein